MSTWPTVIDKIETGDPVSSEIVNVPITQLEERTDFLNDILNDISSTEFNYLKNVPVDIDTPEGSVICWDTAGNCFVGALAQWSADAAAQGALIPKDSGYVQGILVKKHTPNTGAIITSGYIRNFNLIEELFGEADPEPGLYYLSSEISGRVVKTPPPLSIAALHYDGLGNVMFVPSGSVVTNHRHNKYKFEAAGFKEATVINFPDKAIPSEALYGYENSTEVDTFFKNIDTNNACFVKDISGTILGDDKYLLSEDTLWLTAEAVEDMTGFVILPMLEGTNLVDQAKTNTEDILELSIVNGLLTVDKKPFQEGDVVTSTTCLADIDNKNKKFKVPCVNTIKAGLGISLESTNDAGNGVVTIHTTAATNSFIDADIINLNNAVQRTIDSIVYTVMPGGRTSNISYRIPLPYWDGAAREVVFSLWVLGGSPADSFDLTISSMTEPSTTGVSLPTSEVATIPNNVNATDTDKYYEYKVTLPSVITASSLLHIELSTAAVPENDIVIMRQGAQVI
jgi:hypothetical protein